MNTLTDEHISYLHRVYERMKFFREDNKGTLGVEADVQLKLNMERITSIIVKGYYDDGDKTWLNSLRNYIL